MNKLGTIFATVYLVIALFFILTQGLTGESFIALILGLPWSLVFSFFEYWNLSGTGLYVLLLLPIILNAYILCKIGSLISRKS
jgi:hypothetical protein